MGTQRLDLLGCGNCFSAEVSKMPAGGGVGLLFLGSSWRQDFFWQVTWKSAGGGNARL